MDVALTPVADDETETHELFQSKAAQTYVARGRSTPTSASTV